METLDNIKKIKVATSKLSINNILPTRISNSEKILILAKSANLVDKIKDENTTYYICYTYSLDGNTLVLPKGSTLEFRGGAINRGTIVGNDSCIIADKKVFTDIQIKGTWRCVGNVGWWANGSSTVEYSSGIYAIKNNNDYKNIQQALDSSFRELIFPPKLFYTDSTLVLSKEKKLILQGSDMKLNLDSCKDTIHNSCVIFTDKDIDLLRIAVNENNNTHSTVTIQGGSFDTSKCDNYTHDCIQIKTDEGEKIWGLNIDTQIKGRFNNTSGVGINLCPKRDAKAALVESGNRAYNITEYGYVTQIRIKGTISDFGTGIRATNYMNTVPITSGSTTANANTKFYNWCTDVQIDCSINNCKEAIYSNTDTDIRGMIQAGHYYPGNPNNGDALINLDSICASVSTNIYDISLGDTTQYALNIKQPNAVIIADGIFKSFDRICERHLGISCIKGYTERLIK